MPFKVKLFHKYNLFQLSKICNNLCILLVMHLRLKPDHRVEKSLYWPVCQQETVRRGSRLVCLYKMSGGGPRVVVSTAAFHARVRGSVPGLGSLKETETVSSPSACESKYCGEPPWPRGNVLGLRSPGREFWILCLEDSVISIISPFSGGSLGLV